ncbi:MAG: 3-methyl-2-oxobutanoate dehydrogenase subunit beta, partial [Candidatus Melainabacteria bacterium]|nr:3-methyl-2-oxobutanoate dehydrogenase subunit beta [Candidatus Melainabacteria bacterium]
PKDWALTGAKKRDRKIIKTLYLDPIKLEQHNHKIQQKLKEITQNEVRVESYLTEDAEIVIAAYGTVARIAKTAIEILRNKGIKAGLIRPVSLFPFPYHTFENISKRVNKILVVEMSMGQMIEDVKLGVCGASEVFFYGRVGGIVPTYEEIVAEIEKIVGVAS